MPTRDCAASAIGWSGISGFRSSLQGLWVDCVVLSSGGAAPIDPTVTDALVAMQFFFNIDSVVMTRWLMEVRKNYFVPPEYELHAPLPGERPYDAFLSGFNLSTDALEAGLRFLLYPVIEACLEGWQISSS
ncbi:hypothetical protein B296_00043530 [Ensete ventricosum]|uniref:Uncharacterized protein n=1 Tax=Ensete ventricosum TaxID=4639 RepID=A0A426ZE21_ENSVE|nr:hypothetical protein B296_00043530 [Ensete ventricosum]